MPVVVPGYDGAGGNRIERLEQILPIEDEQVAVADENGQLSNLPAAVFGVWYPDIGDLANSIRSLAPLDETQDDEGVPGSRYRRPFKIDAARGLVIFDEPVYRNVHPSANGGAGYEVEIGPAELVLRAACSVRDPETLAIERFIRERASGANLGTEPRYLPHDEIVLTHIPSYDEDYALVDVQSNADAVEPISDHYLDAAEREYQITAPQTFRYAGLVPIEPDGAISQIHFAVGGAGATTSISRNSESPRLGPSHGQKRRRQRQRGRDAAAAKLSPRGLARSLKTNKHAKPRP